MSTMNFYQIEADKLERMAENFLSLSYKRPEHEQFFLDKAERCIKRSEMIRRMK